MSEALVKATPPLPMPQDTEQQFSPFEILSMLKKRIHLVLISTMAVMGIVSAVVFRWPDEYKSETLILVDPQKVPERYVSTTVSMDVAGRLSTINQQLMSVTRLQRIIETYDLYRSLKGHRTQEEIIEQMRKDIKVEVVRNFERGGQNLGAFKITYTGRNPTVVAAVANQLASMFIEENLRVREAQAEGTSEFIDTRLELAKKELDEKEAKLRDFRMKYMGELPEQTAANLATLGQLQAQLQAETEALNRARQQETLFQMQTNGSSSGETTQEGGDSGAPALMAPLPTSPTLARLKQQRELGAASLQQLTLRYSDDFPEVKRTRAMLASLDKQIEDEEKRLAAAPPAAIPQTPVTNGRPGEGPAGPRRDPQVMLRSQLRLAQMEIDNRLKRQDGINARIRAVQAKVDATPLREQEIAQTMRDVIIMRANYQSLLEKKTAADMASDLEKRQKSERFTILDPARIPEKPFRPQRSILLVLGVVAGLGIGLGLIFLLEMNDRAIKREDEVTRYGLRILGRIPLIITAEEQSLMRRHMFRKWVLGGAAAMFSTCVLSGLAYLITGWVFYV